MSDDYSDIYDNPLLRDWADWRVSIGAVAITVAAALAAGGGTGGGGLYVPLMMLVIGFDAKEAIPVSQGCIMGAALALLLLTAGKKHPLKEAPVMDYAALFVLEPMLLTGSILGVMLNGILPSILLLVLLVFVLTAGTYKTYKRARTITGSERRKKETLEKTPYDTPDNNVESYETTKVRGLKTETEGADPPKIVVRRSNSRSSYTKYIMWRKLGLVTTLFVILCGGVLIRGNESGEYSIIGIYYCSGEFWSLTAAIAAIELTFSLWFGKKEIDSQARLKEDGAEPIKDDVSLDSSDYKEVEWNWENVFKYMVYGLICGLLGGCLGIGGGMLLSPLLLNLGFYPPVAAAISGMAVLITSASSLLIYGLSAKVYWQFVSLFMPFTFLATILGKLAIDSYAEKHKKQSLLVWSVVVFLFLCLCMLLVKGVTDIMDDSDFTFSSPCYS